MQKICKMTKKITVLSLILVTFYSYKGQNTSNAKSLLSGLNLDYYSNNIQNDLTTNEANSINISELENENFTLLESVNDSKSRTRKPYNHKNARMKRNISIYRLN